MIKELRRFSRGELSNTRSGLGLLVLDESSISCLRLPEIITAAGGLKRETVLMMLADQYQPGLRGFAKVQILNSVIGLLGILPLGEDCFQDEIGSGWGAVAIPDPIVLHKQRVVVREQRAAVQYPEFALTDSPTDQKWMRRLSTIAAVSNCWYDPVACVYVRDDQQLIEAVSTTYNHSQCASIPFNFRDLKLDKGERLMFCDSQHAEREGVAKAALRGISLNEATAYLSKFPCRSCMENMLGAGIRRLVFSGDSYGLAVAQLLLENGVEVRRLKF